MPHPQQGAGRAAQQRSASAVAARAGEDVALARWLGRAGYRQASSSAVAQAFTGRTQIVVRQRMGRLVRSACRRRRGPALIDAAVALPAATPRLISGSGCSGCSRTTARTGASPRRPGGTAPARACMKRLLLRRRRRRGGAAAGTARQAGNRRQRRPTWSRPARGIEGGQVIRGSGAASSAALDRERIVHSRRDRSPPAGVPSTGRIPGRRRLLPGRPVDIGSVRDLLPTASRHPNFRRSMTLRIHNSLTRSKTSSPSNPARCGCMYMRHDDLRPVPLRPRADDDVFDVVQRWLRARWLCSDAYVPQHHRHRRRDHRRFAVGMASPSGQLTDGIDERLPPADIPAR